MTTKENNLFLIFREIIKILRKSLIYILFLILSPAISYFFFTFLNKFLKIFDAVKEIYYGDSYISHFINEFWLYIVIFGVFLSFFLFKKNKILKLIYLYLILFFSYIGFRIGYVSSSFGCGPW